MARLKILWLTSRGQGYVGAPSTFHGFEQTVARFTDSQFAGWGWELYRKGENLDNTVRRVMPDADWVIDDRDNFKFAPHNRHYRTGVFISDLHGKFSHGIHKPKGFVDLLNRYNYDAVFMKYRTVHGTDADPEIFMKKLKARKFFIPWSVNPTLFYPRKKDVDACFTGAIGVKYRLRQNIYDNLEHVAKGYKIICVTSPSGNTYKRKIDQLKTDYYVGTRYTDLLGRSKITLFDCSRHLYPVQKYFEVPASGCLVMADEPSDAKLLGFVDGETYVRVGLDDWKEKLLYYLKSPEEMADIAQKGMRMIRKRHTHDIRARQFVKVLEHDW